MTLLNSGTGRHPLSTGRRSQDSRERPRTAISGEAPALTELTGVFSFGVFTDGWTGFLGSHADGQG